MAQYKITVDTKKCIGCGACVSTCDNFELVEIDGEQKSNPKKAVISDAELSSNKEAEEICPIGTISIKKKQ